MVCEGGGDVIVECARHIEMDMTPSTDQGNCHIHTQGVHYPVMSEGLRELSHTHMRGPLPSDE